MQPYRDMTPAERVAVTAAVCRAAAALLALHPDRQRVLDLESPWPESTRVALRRLRNG